MAETKPAISFLEFMPVSLFGAIMGLTGLSFCWGWAEETWGVPSWMKHGIAALAVFFFLVLTICYLVKIRKYPALVKAEFNHPVSVSFFGTFIVSLLLLPGILLPYSLDLAIGIWVPGTVLMAVFSWWVFRKWLSGQQEPANALPAWILPIVGTLDIPIVGARLPIDGIREICLLFFGIGLIFGIILLTIIISRLLFQAPLPEALRPTVMILVGPFALATTVYDLLIGQHDMVLSVFYYFDLALFVLLASRIWLLPKCCPFRVSWWSVSFPLVAFTIASFRYAKGVGSPLFLLIPGFMLVLSTIVIFYLLAQSFYRVFTKRFL